MTACRSLAHPCFYELFPCRTIIFQIKICSQSMSCRIIFGEWNIPSIFDRQLISFDSCHLSMKKIKVESVYMTDKLDHFTSLITYLHKCLRTSAGLRRKVQRRLDQTYMNCRDDESSGGRRQYTDARHCAGVNIRILPCALYRALHYSATRSFLINTPILLSTWVKSFTLLTGLPYIYIGCRVAHVVYVTSRN